MLKKIPIRVVSNCSESGLQSLAREFCKTLRGHETIFLEGELGAGKSTFARALIQSLDPSIQTHGSPTYPIVHSYQLSNLNIHHMDLYRIKSEDEIQERGIEELLEDDNSVCLIEWGSLFEKWKQRAVQSLSNKKPCIEVQILRDPSNEHLRSVEIFKLN